jgi:hypothetical protein
LRLQQRAPQRDPLISERRKDGMKDCSGDLLAAFNRMRSVHQHFRLDDRNEALFLTEGGIPRQCVRIGLMQAWLGRVSLIWMTDLVSCFCRAARSAGADARHHRRCRRNRHRSGSCPWFGDYLHLGADYEESI